MKRLMVAVWVAGGALALHADAWKGLSANNYYSGPEITEADLAGKVVLVDLWGVGCPPCRALLPSMQKTWDAFKSKPFMLIGSHCQGRRPEQVKQLVDANKLTYPIYDFAGLVNEPPGGGGLPFMYVVNHRGQVVYSGRSHQEATAAVVNALGELNAPPTLTPGFVFGRKSYHKALEKSLVLGKPTAGVIRKLEGEVKKAGSKTASAQQKEAAEEAEAILKAIAEAKVCLKEDIARTRKTDPVECLKLVKGYMGSFPEEGAAYKAELPDLTAAAKEAEAAKKKEAAEARKNGAKGKK
ncbi:MAG: TlpA disulfide reductase family protein [Kiritimatiellia bacterium]